jgi:hypothetical protein
MVDKRDKRPVQEIELKEKTPKGLEVPIPKRGEFIKNLQKVAKTGSQTKGSPKQ